MSLKVGGSTSLIVASAGTAAAPSIGVGAAGGVAGVGLFLGTGNSLGLTQASVVRMILTSSSIRLPSAEVLGWVSGADPTATAEDAWISRAAVGSLTFGGGANGQALAQSILTENTTIAAAATSTSVIQLPAGAILLAVTSRVTTIGSTSWPATYSVAVGATTVGSAISTALNTTDPGTLLCPIQKAAATSVVITPNTTPGDALGRIRITIHYIQLTPATS